MRRPLVAANWKMHGSKAFISDLLENVCRHLDASSHADVMVCPPAPYLSLCQQLLAGTPVALGAQNVHEASSGAYTGEIAASMLLEFGVSMVIVGHSERRQLFGESDAQVASKCLAVLEQGMQPVLCVGETLEERESGMAESVVSRQVNAVLDRVGVNAMSDAVIAYEPVWAIGTGQTASPGQAQQMHAFIRTLVAARSSDIAQKLRVVYGGSVNAGNAAALFSQADIDGGLVGGASLKPEEFLMICQSVSQ